MLITSHNKDFNEKRTYPCLLVSEEGVIVLATNDSHATVLGRTDNHPVMPGTVSMHYLNHSNLYSNYTGQLTLEND